MFKFALFSKFPWMIAVVFPLKTISPLFVSVPLFGVNIQIHSFWKKTHEKFPCVKSKQKRKINAAKNQLKQEAKMKNATENPNFEQGNKTEWQDNNANEMQTI